MSRDTPLPKLPGYNIAPPPPLGAGFHKRQTLTYRNGYAVPVDAAPAAAPSSTPAACSAQDDWQPLPHHITTYTAVTANVALAAGGSSTKQQPKWLEYDKKVLRFFGYFEEAVPDSREEDWRARKVVVLLYLEDDSMQVLEPAEPNSGLPQGTFVRRHKIPRSTGGFLGLDDLRVGATLTIYSRTIYLTDADKATREFMGTRGVALAEPLPYPVNPIERFKAEKAVPSGLSRTDEDSPSKYAEALLGREPINRELRQFLDNSKQVLSFRAIYDNREALYGDRRHYKLNYFLEDNTVEIMEMLEPNSGKDPFPAFLKRGPLPKVPTAGALPGAGRVPKDQVYKPEDLRLGGYVSVHSREFFIYDCDAFTRRWFQENLGAGESELTAIDVSEPKKPLPKPELPPHNGYGSLEDSLQNCIKLVPTAPKRDMVQLLNRERIILRFRCKLLEGEGYRLINIDKERRFVLSYFGADDSISVYEPPVLNSGITGGKYLERAKARKPGTAAAYYTMRDLRVGARIQLAARWFELLECDKFTEDYLSRMAAA